MKLGIHHSKGIICNSPYKSYQLSYLLQWYFYLSNLLAQQSSTVCTELSLSVQLCRSHETPYTARSWKYLSTAYLKSRFGGRTQILLQFPQTAFGPKIVRILPKPNLERRIPSNSNTLLTGLVWSTEVFFLFRKFFHFLPWYSFPCI